MRLRSVRARTTILASVIVGLTLTLGAVALVVTLRHSLVRSGDDLSRSRAADLAALAAEGDLPRHLTNIAEDWVAQVVDGSGDVLAASPGLGNAGPISHTTPSPGEPVVETLNGVPDDSETENYRVWVLTRQTASGRVTVYVGTSLESVSETIATLRKALIVGVPTMLALLAVGTWIMIGRAFRPVEDIRSEVAGISHSDLDRRVNVPTTADEISRLAATMNDMLARLDQADRRQRTFVADASHELQSPLASLRAQLEVALAHPAGTDWVVTAKGLLDDSNRLERLVRDLLYLARDEAGTTTPPRDLVDLDDVVLEEVVRLRGNTTLGVDTSDVSAAPVRGSSDDLARLMRNLLENAADHAASAIRVELRTSHGHALLAVTDDGPGVPPAHRAHVFDRFYRADQARSRADAGTGLGLAIARAVAERHGGTLTLDESSSGARFVLSLPSA